MAKYSVGSPTVAQVVAFNPNDAVRLGLTALPNANANAANGLFTRGTGAGQINQDADGRIDTRTVNMASNVVTAAALATDAVTEIVAGLMAFAHDTGVTVKGLFRRLDAFVAGKATGLNSATAKFFMRDGATEAINATQDTTAGTRSTATVTGSEA